MKRLIDIALSVVGIITFLPVFLLIPILIRLDDGGPVFFRQARLGQFKRPFRIYKFRSMRDGRVTRIGRWLRRSGLDEIPQFLNIYKGEMSVVGPRPHAVAHNEQYRKVIKGYMIRHKVNPGITGLAQVSGLRGETATVDDMRRRVEADLDYLRNWSLTLDIRIIFKTVFMIFGDKKAY